MPLRNTLTGYAAAWLIERPARKHTLDEWAAVLEAGGAKIAARAAPAHDTPAARAAMRHVIGIERWGQSRLRVFLGAPLTLDEYDNYAPAADLDLTALRAAFAATRAQTVALARQLAAANLPADATVAHNALGPFTARGWLEYLSSHAARETWRVR